MPRKGPSMTFPERAAKRGGGGARGMTVLRTAGPSLVRRLLHAGYTDAVAPGEPHGARGGMAGEGEGDLP
jgi:hypothetical protein